MSKAQCILLGSDEIIKYAIWAMMYGCEPTRFGRCKGPTTCKQQPATRNVNGKVEMYVSKFVRSGVRIVIDPWMSSIYRAMKEREGTVRGGLKLNKSSDG
jgi:hypothetical protein